MRVNRCRSYQQHRRGERQAPKERGASGQREKKAASVQREGGKKVKTVDQRGCQSALPAPGAESDRPEDPYQTGRRAGRRSQELCSPGGERGDLHTKTGQIQPESADPAAAGANGGPVPQLVRDHGGEKRGKPSACVKKVQQREYHGRGRADLNTKAFFTGQSAANRNSGFIYTPSFVTSKWRWGPVTLPDVPTSASFSPAETSCP